MRESSGTKAELIAEISDLKQKIKKLEKSEAKRRRAEEALRASEDNFRQSLDESPLGVRIVTTESDTIYANRAILDFYGYDSIEEFKTTPVEKRYTPESYAEFQIRSKKKKQGVDVPSEYTIDIIRKNGEVRHLQVYRKEILWNGERQYQVVYQDITERKQAAEALHTKENRFRSVVEKSLIAIAIVNDCSQFTYVNEELCNLAGYSEYEILGQNFTFLLSEESKELAAERYKRRQRGEDVPSHYEFLFVRKNGEKRIGEVRSAVYLDSSGKVNSLIQIIDITDRKRAEEALHAAEETYRNIFLNAQTGLFRTDMNTGLILDANDCVARFLGHKDRRELLSKPFNIAERYVDLKDREMMTSLLKEHGQFTDFEARFRRNDGSIIWMRYSARLVPDKGWIEGVSEDITKEKDAVESLRKSEERYRSLVENANEAIYVAQDGMIKFFNRAGVEIAGYSEQEIISKPFIEFIHPDDRAMVGERYLKRLKGEGFESRYTFRFIAKNGDIKWLELGGALIDFEGRPAALNIVTDITERKRMEEEKRSLQERLQHADKMDAIGTLAGGIAHDFNNLLMGIQGYASLTLLDLDPSHPHYERLKRIEEQVQSGADLTSQLLGFARGGRYEVNPADMNEIIKKTSSLFGRTKKEISIHRKHGKDLWSVEVDRGQMEQVFLNLYVNAWQAMPGGGEIYLETEKIILDGEQALSCSVKPGKYVKITVTDTGTGMDEKTRERIFDPFFTTKEMGRGTGLGMATVYGIIKGHQGMIHVDSKPGQGTTFTIYLPASEKEVVKEKTATGTIARGKEMILVVDDEKMVLEVDRELLESMGYRVYAVGSGQEAISVYMEKRNEIDLVILDMIMPGISGSETFDRLREINPGIKVLLSSGYSLTGKAQTIMDRGCNGFLQKPFHLEQLASKVRELLD